MSGMTAAKFASLYTLLITPLGTADITGALTLYKRCRNGSLATLSVASGTQRRFDPSYYWPGIPRCVSVASATVTSLVDMQGNAVSSDTSIIDPTFTYTPGSVVTAKDLYNEGTTFLTGSWGIKAYTTKFEAAAHGLEYTPLPTPNLAALGL